MLPRSDVVQEFVRRINAHDVKGLISLMTDDHIFIDSLGARSTRPDIETGWELYFRMVPDYWIRVERRISEGDQAVLIGAAGGTYVPQDKVKKTDNKWETPAVWIARVKGLKIAEWRIYADNEPMREKMRRRSP